uniref:Secreted protein n=1 Tax=Apis cerana TaxID=7461 RepID=V9I8P3_APICE
MIKLHMCFLLKICVITAATNKTFLDTPDNLTLFRLMRTWILNNFEKRTETRCAKGGNSSKRISNKCSISLQRDRRQISHCS